MENANTITVKYSSSVKTPAGWREVSVKAVAEKVSDKKIRVVQVLEIDDEVPNYGQSRTGANRQKFNGIYFAKIEECKNKLLSSCEIAK